MDVADLRIGEHSFDRKRQTGARRDLRRSHHPGAIEGAQRDMRASAQASRDFIDGAAGLRRGLTDIDGVTRAIGRVGGLMLIVQQQERLADGCVLKGDSARKADRGGGDVSEDATSGEVLFRQAEQWAKLIDRQAGDHERHGWLRDG